MFASVSAFRFGCRSLLLGPASSPWTGVRILTPVSAGGRGLERPLGGRYAGGRDHHFLRETGFRRGQTDVNFRLIERFTRVSLDTLMYEVTVEDPTVWTRPWTYQIPMVKSEQPLYEHACHEGNYGLYNMLSGARAAETAAAKVGSR